MRSTAKETTVRAAPAAAPTWRNLGVFLVLTAVAALVGQPPAAHASDPRNLDIRDSPSALLGVDTTLLVPHLSPYVSLSASLANDELVAVDSAGKSAHGPLNDRWTFKLAAGLGLFDRLEIGVALPVIAATVQPRTPLDAASESVVGVGDLRVFVKARLLGAPNDEAGFGLGLAAELTLPTGDGSTFAGEGGVSGTPWLVLDYRDPQMLHIALNLGFRLRPVDSVGDLAIGNELRYSLGVEVPLHAYGLSLIGELQGGLGFGESPADPSGVSGRKAPLEVLGALRWRHRSGVDLLAGFGAGLTSGYGAPDYRATFRVAWALGHAPAHAFDETKTTAVAEDPDKTPTGGGTSGAGGGRLVPSLPKIPAVKALDAAKFDEAARKDPDADGDGLPRGLDKCPDEPEDADNFEDEDGCPDLDNDRDGVPDAVDKCPLKRETVNGVEDEDGCPDEGAAAVIKTAGKFELKGKVMFASGRDHLKTKSHPLLRQVAAMLKASPEVRLVHIEGHTDSQGNQDANVDLSIRRAFAVKRFLVGQGVQGKRLVARGYGPLHPVASNKNNKGRRANRRVEFVIKDRSHKGAKGAGR